MARGTLAKENITNRLKEVFEEDFIGEYDKKVYLWADDEGGERIQVALAMTCPKTFVGDPESPRGKRSAAALASDISVEEQERIKKLIEMFNL